MDRRKIIVLALSFVILAAVIAALVVIRLDRKVYDLRYGNITSSGFTVTWRTDGPADALLLVDSPDTNALTRFNSPIFYESRELSDGYSHLVEVTGLDSDTDYLISPADLFGFSEVDPVVVRTLEESQPSLPTVHNVLLNDANGFGVANQIVLLENNEDRTIILNTNSDGGSSFDMTGLEGAEYQAYSYTEAGLNPLENLFLDPDVDTTTFLLASAEADVLGYSTCRCTNGTDVSGQTGISLDCGSTQKICGADKQQYKCLRIDGKGQWRGTGEQCSRTSSDLGRTSCKCTGGKNQSGATVEARCGVYKAVCGQDSNWYSCTASGSWQNTRISCGTQPTSAPKITAIPTKTPAPAACGGCSGGIDSNGNPATANRNQKNAVCGADFQYYDCNSSCDWVGNGKSCGKSSDVIRNELLCTGSSGSWNGSSCTCPSGMRLKDNYCQQIPQPTVTTRPTSCKCVGGTDNYGNNIEADCGEEVCGDKNIVYECNQSANWQATNRTCLSTDRVDEACRCKFGVDSDGNSNVSAACGEEICGYYNQVVSCENGTWKKQSASCGTPTPTPKTPAQVRCEASLGTWRNSRCQDCPSGTSVVNNECKPAEAQCPQGYNLLSCSDSSCPAGFLTITNNSCTNGISCCQPTRNTTNNDCTDQCTYGSCQPGTNPNDGQFSCACNYGNKTSTECNPPPIQEVNLVFSFDNSAGGDSRQFVSEVNVRYMQRRPNGSVGYKIETVRNFSGGYIIILPDTDSSNANITVNVVNTANSVCSNNVFYLGSRFREDPDRPGEKRVDVSVDCVSTVQDDDGDDGDVGISDPVNEHGLSTVPLDPNYQDHNIANPSNYVELIKKVAYLVNSYNGKSRIPWWVIAGVLRNESSFSCGRIGSSSALLERCTGNPNQIAFTYNSTYGSVGVSQHTPDTFNSLADNSYWWRSANTDNLNSLMNHCIDGLGVDRTKDREDDYASSMPQRIINSDSPYYSRIRVGDALCALAIQISDNGGGGDYYVTNTTRNYIPANQWSEDTIHRGYAHYWGVKAYWDCQNRPGDKCGVVKRYGLEKLCEIDGRSCNLATSDETAEVLGASDQVGSRVLAAQSSAGVTYLNDYNAVLAPGSYSVRPANDNVIFESKIITVPDSVDDFNYNLYLDTNINQKRDDGEDLVNLRDNAIIEKISDSYTYDIIEGWNLLNFPFESSEFGTAAEFLNTTRGKGILVKTIATYSNNSFKTLSINENQTLFGDDFALTPGLGVFVLSDTSGALSIQGTPVSVNNTSTLDRGWNLIGLRLFRDLSAAGIVSECEANGYSCDTVSKYEAGRYQSLIKDDGQLFGSDFNLISKAGYFVRVSETGDGELDF